MPVVKLSAKHYFLKGPLKPKALQKNYYRSSSILWREYALLGLITRHTISSKKSRTASVLKNGFAPRNISGWRGMLKAFLSASASQHCRRIWRTVSLSPHVPHIGGSLRISRKLWMPYVCPIYPESTKQDICSCFRCGGPEAQVFVSSSHMRCQWLCSFVRKKRFRSVAGTAVVGLIACNAIHVII